MPAAFGMPSWYQLPSGELLTPGQMLSMGTGGLPAYWGRAIGELGKWYTPEGYETVKKRRREAQPQTLGDAPATTATSTTSPLTSAASALASASKPAVPQFVQPYQRVRGSGAFGEADVLGRKTQQLW